MKRNRKGIGIVFLLIISFLISCEKYNKHDDYLILFTDSTNNLHGYKNLNEETIIPPGKYEICFTDTFRTYAIVLKPQSGFVAIDRQENILYQVFPFDNGPDYTSDGLFRIIVNNKIGFAETITGKVIIEPIFKCAWPFENGLAKVSNDCTIKSDGEHTIWLSNNWYYVNKQGNKVK